MSATYSIFLTDPFGVRLTDALPFVRLEYTRVVNDISSLKVSLPVTTPRTAIIVPDGRVEVFRRLPGGREYLDTDVTWLIKAVEYSRDDGGLQTLIVEADTPLSLLREPGRFVDYYSESAQAKQTGNLDDMAKQIVRQNAGSLATDTNRNLAPYLTVAPNLSAAPSDTKAFAWRGVLNVLQELAQASREQGTYMAFDIVAAPSPETYEFRTYTGQRGVDHRAGTGDGQVIIGPDFGNTGACSLRIDYRDEVTFVRAGGQLTGADRVTATAQDNTRIGASPFGRRELFQDATQYSTTTGLTQEAQAALRAGRARITVQTRVRDTPDTRYGVHWGWGDILTFQGFGYSLDVRIDAVTVTVEGGERQFETIDAWARNNT